ncbi:MAG: IS3 family transposase [Ruminococcus sp.]|nr:IS3 family transposase [Ruminococcus sp.]
MYENNNRIIRFSSCCAFSLSISALADERRLIDDYIYFYNHQRIQLKTKLTPLELRSRFVA